MFALDSILSFCLSFASGSFSKNIQRTRAKRYRGGLGYSDRWYYSDSLCFKVEKRTNCCLNFSLVFQIKWILTNNSAAIIN